MVNTAAQKWLDELAKNKPKKIKHSNSVGSDKSYGEELLIQHLKTFKRIDFQREYRFDTLRRWRFDIAWPTLLFAVEIEGGTGRFASQSRHTSYTGYSADLEKYNQAVLSHWRVLRFTTAQVKTGYAIEMINRFFDINSQIGK